MIETNEFDIDSVSFSDGEYSAEKCAEKFSFNKMKRGKKKQVYTCIYDDCDKSYSRSSHLRRHEAIHENSSYRCTEKDCENIFKTKFTLKKHVDNFHLKKNPKKYKCPDCDQEFNKHNWLTRHQIRHTGISPFVCTVEGCGRRFVFPSKLKRHLKVHDGYACSKENCDQKFPTWTLYIRHVKNAHPIIHRCEYCEKIFSRSTNLKDHLEVHKLDRQVHLCPKANCSRFYFTNRSLNYHLKSYHEKRPFECTLKNCYKAFKSQEDLNAHTKHHDSKKRSHRKKKGKAKPTFAEKLAGLVTKNISSSSNTVKPKPEDLSSENEYKNTSIPDILTNAQSAADENSEFGSPVESEGKIEGILCFANSDTADGNSDLLSPVEFGGRNEDILCSVNSDRIDKNARIESNRNFEEKMPNRKLIRPQITMKCIPA